jgi:hypothetical protein
VLANAGSPPKDLGPGDFVKVDCAACRHTALLVREADRLALRAKLAPAFVDRLGLSPRHKVLDLNDHVQCRGCGVRGRAVVSIKRGKPGAWSRMTASTQRTTIATRMRSTLPNALYFGHNLVVLRNRKHFPDQSVDLNYLDPPLSDSYNVPTPSGTRLKPQTCSTSMQQQAR